MVDPAELVAVIVYAVEVSVDVGVPDIAHVFVFNLVVNWLNWVRPTGLDTALVLSLAFYIAAVPISSLYLRKFGIGPFERVYRAFGG